ncbi:excinuclease [Pseudomonas sp. LABIM340]|uniref:Excinuclease n=1 Tax=Pseudomonas nitroreducens TaxID=46680 RepID=A0A5R9A895_PSENT|nr:excinuclease [Pseudomonas nitroreducens]TLP74861.1 excinuclease [Pseudomonas nitroreducens]
MQRKTLGLFALALCASIPGISQARDTTLHLPFDEVVAEAVKAGRLDGSVKFYLAGNPAGDKLSVVQSGAITNKKTNAFNKSDEEACRWALQSALITLQDSAKKAGATAVTNIVSYYKRNEFKDAKQFECHAGAVIAGVALKGDYAK